MLGWMLSPQQHIFPLPLQVDHPELEVGFQRIGWSLHQIRQHDLWLPAKQYTPIRTQRFFLIRLSSAAMPAKHLMKWILRKNVNPSKMHLNNRLRHSIAPSHLVEDQK